MNFPTTAIIQARMGSSRLPGKVMLEIAGQPMLVRVVERSRRAARLDQVVVATTIDPSDDPVAELCEKRGYNVFRGSVFDVLDRYYQAASRFEAGLIVRLTADCPLIDPDVIDRTVEAFSGNIQPEDVLLSRSGPIHLFQNSNLEVRNPFPFDFAANRLPPPWGRTYPIGLDAEVCTFTGLETAWREAREPHQREHVMPFFYDHLERFRVLLVNDERDFGSLRWTVDTPADLELVRQVYASFRGREDFSWLETLALFERHPELTQINAGVAAKHYLQVDDRQDEAAS